MANTITTAFIINGILSSSFTSSTKTAKMQLEGMQKTVKRLQKAQAALNTRFTNGGMSVALYDKNIQKLEKSLNDARAEYTKLQTALSDKVTTGMRFNEARGNLISSVLTVGTMAQPFMGAAKTAIAFEAAMSKVGAISRATSEELAALTKTARSLGEKTQFTATQAAEAMSYLGMAGWNSQQIMAGMPGLLNLAAAGGTDLARTADIVSDNLTAFNLAAEKSGHMADVYATVITRTNTNVDMLGDTMKYAAPVAYAFGVSMEETAALAGLMANSGIKASQAGTSLRAGFLRLAGPPKAATKAMDQLGMSIRDITAEQKEAAIAMKSLGISMENAQGPKKISAILTELRKKMQVLSGDQQLATMKAIFGEEAATGWLAVLNSGDGVFEKLVAGLERSGGAAEQMAVKMNANAKGALTRLSSAYESLQISLMNGFLPVLANVGDEAAAVVGKFSDWAGKNPAIVQAVLTSAGAFAGLWVTLRAGQMVFATGKFLVDSMRLSMLLLSKCQELLAGKTVLATGAAKAWNAAVLLSGKAMAIFQTGLTVTGGFITVLRAGFMKLWAVLMANPWIALATLAVGAGIMIYQNWDSVKQWFTTLWDNPALALQQFCDGVKNLLGGALQWVEEKWQKISEFLSTPIFGKVNITAGGDTGAQIAQNAAGGIYNRGAFVTTFAEKSGESAIPHTPNKRNIGLLAQTNAIMGDPLHARADNGRGDIQLSAHMNAYKPRLEHQAINQAIVPKMNIPVQNFISGNVQNYAVSVPTLSLPEQNFPEQLALNGGILGRANASLNNSSVQTNVTAKFAPQITIQGNADREMVEEAIQQQFERFKAWMNDLQKQQRRVSYV